MPYPTFTVIAEVRDRLGARATSTALAELFDRSMLDYKVDDPIGNRVGLLPWMPRSAGASLTLQPGGTYDNRTIDNLPIVPAIPTGWSREAATIRIRNAHFRGLPGPPPGSGVTGLIHAFGANHCPVIIEDSLFRPRFPHENMIGIHGYDVTAIRCEFSDVVDGVEGFQHSTNADGPVNNKLVLCWMHDFAYWLSVAADPAYGSHNDGGQIEGGVGHIFWGCRIDGFIGPQYGNGGLTAYGTRQLVTSPFLIKPDAGNIAGVDIQFCRLDGGSVGINISHRKTTPIRYLGNIGIIRSNRFGRNFRLGRDFGILMNTTPTTNPITFDRGSVAAGTANLYADTLTEVLIRNGG